MDVVPSFDQIRYPRQRPITLTIGNFDGMHRGHQALLKELVMLARPDGLSVAITYANHPSEILRPQTPTPLLSTVDHKLALMEEIGINVTVLLTFEPALAAYDAESFLAKVHGDIPFSHLILGHDAHFGKNRSGTPETVRKIAEKQSFCLTYLPPVLEKGEPISSTTLRKLIPIGDLLEASLLLGRPYSIMGQVITGQGRGQGLGFATANISLDKLCTPPHGVYVVRCRWRASDGVEQIARGVANLGAAPTLHKDRPPLLEVHLPGLNANLYGIFLEVVFERFLRPEQTFPSQEALREQIARDIASI